VLYACSEIYPLLKTGGLADVSGALPAALAEQGADVRLLLPAFPAISAGVQPQGLPLVLPAGDSNHPLLRGMRDLGPRAETARGMAGGTLPTSQSAPWLQPGRIRSTGQAVYLLHAPGLYHRQGSPYVDAQGHPWPDSAQQFAWLSWAAALLGVGLDNHWHPDVVHGHDWHTGLAPAYMHVLARHGCHAASTVFTVHNLAYQGVFDASVRPALGIPDELFHMHGVEFHGQLSFMKGGLKYAHTLTTVSPTYAREITGHEQGCGLDGVLRHRQASLHGILNGVDGAVWNPAADPQVQPGYDAQNMQGKRAAKARLQAELGLQTNPQALLFVGISRLTEQKGLNLLPAVVDELVLRGGQLAVLGSGDADIEHALRQCEERHPGRVALRVGYDEALAHRMVAGGDVILVPSRFEPCGLTQLYGLRYGTLPLVRAVGGLADTVTDCSLENLHDGVASGFVFQQLQPADLLAAMRRACALFHRPADWQAVQQHAMSLRFDWARAAKAYMALYRQASVPSKRKNTGGTAHARTTMAHAVR
jgi:starch synthase